MSSWDTKRYMYLRLIHVLGFCLVSNVFQRTPEARMEFEVTKSSLVYVSRQLPVMLLTVISIGKISKGFVTRCICSNSWSRSTHLHLTIPSFLLHHRGMLLKYFSHIKLIQVVLLSQVLLFFDWRVLAYSRKVKNAIWNVWVHLSCHNWPPSHSVERQ